SHPQIVSSVLINSANSRTETSVPAVALNAAIVNRAQLTESRKPKSADPYCSFMILEEVLNDQSGKLWILLEFAVLPAGEPLRCPNPKCSIAPREQTPYRVREKMLIT